jgi:hypothetical protein
VTAKAIVGYLRGLPLEVLRVSLREVKRAVNYYGSNETFQEARSMAIADCPTWSLDGRSLVRI